MLLSMLMKPKNSTPNSLLISDPKQPTHTRFLPSFIAVTMGLLRSRCCHGGSHRLQPPIATVAWWHWWFLGWLAFLNHKCCCLFSCLISHFVSRSLPCRPGGHRCRVSTMLSSPAVLLAPFSRSLILMLSLSICFQLARAIAKRR